MYIHIMCFAQRVTDERTGMFITKVFMSIGRRGVVTLVGYEIAKERWVGG